MHPVSGAATSLMPAEDLDDLAHVGAALDVGLHAPPHQVLHLQRALLWHPAGKNPPFKVGGACGWDVETPIFNKHKFQAAGMEAVVHALQQVCGITASILPGRHEFLTGHANLYDQMIDSAMRHAAVTADNRVKQLTLANLSGVILHHAMSQHACFLISAARYTRYIPHRSQLTAYRYLLSDDFLQCHTISFTRKLSFPHHMLA